MTVAEQVLQLLRTTEALLEGHFLLTSGQHSGSYVQCAKVLQYPQHAEALGGWIADSFRGLAVDVVMSPAVGGNCHWARSGPGPGGAGHLWRARGWGDDLTPRV